MTGVQTCALPILSALHYNKQVRGINKGIINVDFVLWFHLASMFMVLIRMFFIQPAAASWTLSSSEPVSASKV